MNYKLEKWVIIIEYISFIIYIFFVNPREEFVLILQGFIMGFVAVSQAFRIKQMKEKKRGKKQ